MGSHEYLLIFFSIICVIAALGMVFLKNPISVALSLLLVLLASAGIYGAIGEHLIATLQLVIYAGAIMVLFIFSIMLLNIDVEVKKVEGLWSKSPYITFGFAGISMFLLMYSVIKFTSSSEANYQIGIWTQEKIIFNGGTSWLLSLDVLGKHFLLFELVGVTLLIGAVGAVVLAKRKL